MSNQSYDRHCPQIVTKFDYNRFGKVVTDYNLLGLLNGILKGNI